MVPDRRSAEPGPGMPGLAARPPGWRRRGRRRPQRTRRIARSRRFATRRPHPAGPGRSRHEELPQPALHTGTSCSAGRGRRTRARTARVVPPGAGGRPGRPRTNPARPQRGGGTPRRGSVVPRMQWHELAHQLEDVYVVGEPVEQGPAGGHRILECGPLPGRHTTTVGQNHQSPGGLNSGCLPAASQCSTVTPPARHAERLPYGRATHVNRRSGRPVAGSPWPQAPYGKIVLSRRQPGFSLAALAIESWYPRDRPYHAACETAQV